MTWHQKTINLRPQKRGIHLIGREITSQIPEIANYRVGQLHLFIMHTSASLTLTENADPDVRGDLDRHLAKLVPENAPHYRHTIEGPDDMPAHIKASMLDSSLLIPITNGRLALGTWQGICLCEHRIHGGSRKLVATLQGELFPH